MVKKYWILGVIVFILLVSVVSINAIPPSTQVFTGDIGYEIEYPTNTIHEQNTPFEFHFHVFNLSSGVPILNETTTCAFHLYDDEGNHIYENIDITLINHDYDFFVSLNANNFSDIGEYGYIFQCNSSDMGGFVSVPFKVTSSGTEEDSGKYTAIAMCILIGIMMFFFFAMGYVYSKEESFMFYLCYLFWYIALFLPLYALRIAANVEEISTRVKLLIETLYGIYLRIYWVLIIILVAYFIVLFFSWLWFWHKKPAWKRKKLEV